MGEEEKLAQLQDKLGRAQAIQESWTPRKGFDYQERWHGFGSPVGLGIGLVSIGAFLLLLALAIHIFSL